MDPLPHSDLPDHILHCRRLLFPQVSVNCPLCREALLSPLAFPDHPHVSFSLSLDSFGPHLAPLVEDRAGLFAHGHNSSGRSRCS
jgi:hypothetical protein